MLVAREDGLFILKRKYAKIVPGREGVILKVIL
jgi:hypothetical protein